MLRLSLEMPDRAPRSIEWTKPNLSIGRAAGNDLQIPADNVSSQHGRIFQNAGAWFFEDLHSTNGTILVRDGQKYLLDEENRQVMLEPEDRLCFASLDNALVIEATEELEQPDDDEFGNTILAEAPQQAVGAVPEQDLHEDHEALRCAVALARELAGMEKPGDIAELACQTCLDAFPRARRALFLQPDGRGFRISCQKLRASGETSTAASTLVQSPKLIDRCLRDRKGFIFIIEGTRMEAIATMVAQIDQLEDEQEATDRIIMCCPMFQHESCYGFLEVEAPLDRDRSALTRRDLSLANLMSHLIAARLHDLESQRARLKLARKATAGFLSATVGHCFKNLLFVPMSISRMLPMCVREGKMEEVEWMLSRNLVNIRYLDMLSNEFAAASKDPSEGFGLADISPVIHESAELVNQIDQTKLESHVELPEQMPEIYCHGAALKRLIMNLTLNAVDAILGENQERKGRIDLGVNIDETRNVLRVTVRDNGPGIPEAILTNLREIFRQVQASADALGELQNIAERVRSTKDQGFKEHYGLGFLFVCQTVHHHRGDLIIETEPGQGTTFHIDLPINPTTTGHTAAQPTVTD